MSQRLRPLYGPYVAKLPSWRQAFFVLIGVAFFLQSYVAQTHIHPLTAHRATADRLASLAPDGVAKADKSDRGVPPRDRLPGNDDPAKCPLCQAVGHAGQYVWPNAALFILPQLAAAIVPVAVAILQIPQAQSHNWQGRAPPRH
jgi:hypothetical protein